MTDSLDLWHLLTSARFTGASEPALTLCRDLAARGHGHAGSGQGRQPPPEQLAAPLEDLHLAVAHGVDAAAAVQSEPPQRRPKAVRRSSLAADHAATGLRVA